VIAKVVLWVERMEILEVEMRDIYEVCVLAVTMETFWVGSLASVEVAYLADNLVSE